MIAGILGGIGLFLLGMALLTDGLKALAGESLRVFLTRFAGGALGAVGTGAAVTALVQSSSATTLATIGCVSAGLLTFQQAVGVIFGANIGTTSTGWIVAAIGLKVNVAAWALPAIGAGAVMRLLGRGRLPAAGTTLAGFGLIFLGIGTLQTGMADFGARFDLTAFGGSGLGTRAALVLVGALMTVVMQSSSAAVATTLAALHAGSIGLEQAAALVIGQNIGTTVTAALATIGASLPARRTALAHILFNVLTGIVAFALLPAFLAAGQLLQERAADLVMSVAVFHTLFNVLGVALLLPVIRAFSELIVRLLPARGAMLTRHLDVTVAQVAQVGAAAVRLTAALIAAELTALVRRRLDPVRGPPFDPERLAEARSALDETYRFLGMLPAAGQGEVERSRRLHTLHALDHLGELAQLTAAAPDVQATPPALLPTGLVLEVDLALERLGRWLAQPEGDSPGAHLAALAERVSGERSRYRERLLGALAAGELPACQVQRALDLVRWLEQVMARSARIAHYLQEEPAAAAASGELLH